jgi:hypothetical protein
MDNPKFNLEYLNQLITNGTEEGLHLEYKAGRALSKSDGHKTEITKDVSAMANAAGGLIIYGIKEFDEKSKRHLPEGIDPVDRRDFSQEWLDQIISGIQPKISNLLIHPISITEGTSDVVYIVEVPMGLTAHQATDKKYHRRSLNTTYPLSDYEIREIMARSKHPQIDLKFSMNDSRKRRKFAEGIWMDSIMISGYNSGSIIANHVFCDVEIPHCMVIEARGYRKQKPYSDKDGQRVQRIRFDGRNITCCGVDGIEHLTPPAGDDKIISPHQINPIIPGREVQLCAIEVRKREEWYESLKNSTIKWTVWADQSGAVQGNTDIVDFYHSNFC